MVGDGDSLIDKLCAIRKAVTHGNLTVFKPSESPKPVKKKAAVAAGPRQASISMPAVRATSATKRKRERSPVSDDGKPPAKFIPATPLGKKVYTVSVSLNESKGKLSSRREV